MDVKAYKLGKASNQAENQLIHNVSHHQFREIGLYRDAVQPRYSLVDWHKDSRLSCANEFISHKNTSNTTMETNPDWRVWKADSVPNLHSQLSVDGASKEHINQKMLPCRLQNMIQHEISDSSLSGQATDSLISSTAYSNQPCPLVDYSRVVSTACNTLRGDSGSTGDYSRGVATASLGSGGTSMLAPIGVKQPASEMLTSPERILPIIAYSDAHMYSDFGPFDGRPAFPGSNVQNVSDSPEMYVQQKQLNEGELSCIKYGGLQEKNQNASTMGFTSFLGEKLELPFSALQNLEQHPEKTSEASDILLSMNCNIPVSSCEDSLEPKPQMPVSQQFHQRQKRSFVQHGESSEAQPKYHLFEQDEQPNEIMGQDTSKVSYLPPEQSHGVQHVNAGSSTAPSGPTECAPFMHSSVLGFRRILLSYMHYKRMHVDGSQVFFVKYLHSRACNEFTCKCDYFFRLLSHFDNCHCRSCNICKPVKRFFVTGKPPLGSRKQGNCQLRAYCSRDVSGISLDRSQDTMPPAKRLKIGNLVSSEIGVSSVVAASKTQPCKPEWVPQLQQWPEAPVSNDLDATGVPAPLQDSASTSSTRNNVSETAQRFESNCIHNNSEELIDCSEDGETVLACINEATDNATDNLQVLNSCSTSLPSQELILDHKEEREVSIKSDQAKLETKTDSSAVVSDSGTRSEKPKIVGVSLVDFFTAEETKEHLSSLRQGVIQGGEGNPMTYSVGDNLCQLCSMGNLVFAPLPIYCSSCGVRIKRNLIYYCALDDMGIRHCFCTSCFRGSHGVDISFHGITISKAKLIKEKNNHEDDEAWVLCDKCKGWQHQICALYNDKRDSGGKAVYICPKCYLKGLDAGGHIPLPKTVAFGAKDLPTTMLGDYIEQRLFRRLKEERAERAKALQKNIDEVPAATDLVVRVVLSASKLLKVKQQFLDIFHDQNYPSEFPYKSKAILLFQKIEGVDVCLFGLYVQEFGSECAYPNQRCVYVSYLDSVKYFRPEIRTVSGEALRTFVYHEILIGYLDYCKKRGFATCYIWACPPLRGEDYILYCHPETQKTPKPNKLRQWYKLMLQKAAKEHIVVDCANLYDHFFVPTGQHNIKISAARLPYFDGDYWSGAVVDMIKNFEQGSQVGSQSKVKKVLTKRTLKAMGHENLSADATKDILLMQKLGQAILPVKEDFIVVHLHFTCTHCHEVIQSGSRWCCCQCKNFQLCARCHDVEQNLSDGKTHTSSGGEKHFISEVAVNDMPVDTEDTDVSVDNGILENRHSFLSLCQGSHYQFDTLRRAKHSSMMILYHLHNSMPSFGATCCICHQEILVSPGWHCDSCPGFDACDGCYRKKGDDCHIHKLSQRPLVINYGSKNGQAQPQKHMLVRQILDLLMHASQCNATKRDSCSYPNCFQIKMLFHHTRKCNMRLAGGCGVCQKTWKLLRLHSRNCRDSDCQIPRCMDLKKHAEMLALFSETRQRAAVAESLRVC